MAASARTTAKTAFALNDTLSAKQAEALGKFLKDLPILAANSESGRLRIYMIDPKTDTIPVGDWAFFTRGPNGQPGSLGSLGTELRYYRNFPRKLFSGIAGALIDALSNSGHGDIRFFVETEKLGDS